jgi:hypothetical protein
MHTKGDHHHQHHHQHQHHHHQEQQQTLTPWSPIWFPVKSSSRTSGMGCFSIASAIKAQPCGVNPV